MEKHHVLIADDHTIVREGLRALLSSEGDLEVIGEVDNGRDALRCLSTLQPHVIVMDLSMPQLNGTEAIRYIKKRYPDIKIVVLTFHRAEEYVRASLEAGADGYVLKSDSQTDLVGAIRSAIGGKTYLSPSIADKVVTGYLGQPGTPAGTLPSDTLTHREREVLKLIAEGHKNKDIAAALSISPKTVEKHRANLMTKLNLHSAAALTAYAIENGLVVQ
ncbi:MAG: response regulator [Acidiferrobacterales bacterium]